MSECWAEGELRAYLDRELPEQSQVAAHLRTCAECSARYLEVAERAARVGSLVALLPEPAPRRPERVWTPAKTAAAAVLALAAALIVGFVMLPKSRTVEHARTVMTPALPVQPAPPAVEPAPVVVAPAIVRHPVVHRPRPEGPVLRADYFVPLDDEPIETGTVVKVGIADTGVQAEMIVGSDGRARAIRILDVGNKGAKKP